MSDDEKIYPCDNCGIMRSKNEGGTVFTVCDLCWDRKPITPFATGTCRRHTRLDYLRRLIEDKK